MRKSFTFTTAVLAGFLALGSFALAAPGSAKTYPTRMTVGVGEYTTGEGAAPVVEGTISSGKAVCRKGRQVMGQLTPSDGESVITLAGAASKADGNWSIKLPALDYGKAGTLEIVADPKHPSSKVTCGKATYRKSVTL